MNFNSLQYLVMRTNLLCFRLQKRPLDGGEEPDAKKPRVEEIN
jgi:hypothetical protein